jgi:molybdopterin molybdotransferase
MSQDPNTPPRPSRSDHDSSSLGVAEATRRILAESRALPGLEHLAVRAALDRVLARDVLSPIDVPLLPNSAMDGYALNAADLPSSDDRDAMAELRIVGRVMAGEHFDGRLQPGQCVRIMTGAPIPAGADTVVMQEHAQRSDDRIRIASGHRAGQNVRQAGEDLAKGAVALTVGTRLKPADLGLLASLGIAEVPVRRRPRVAFFSTGDELRSLGEVLEPGQIYDSNRYTLYGMLTRLGVEVLDMGIVRDRREDVRAALEQAAQIADVVITSGGVSVGEADFVKETLDELGQVGFWKIAMKPGRPLAFGRVGQALFFGLPGNPVSVMVTFYQFVLPALLRLTGQTPPEPVRLRIPTADRLKKRPGRTEFQRGLLRTGADGELKVHSTGDQGSGILSSMSKGDCFILLPEDSDGAQPGDLVEVQPFAGLI